MKNPLTVVIETRIGVVVVASWAALFVVLIFRAQADYTNLLANLHVTAPQIKGAGRIERERINHWIAERGLNPYGDPIDTVYAGGTPLFDEQTGMETDRYAYMQKSFPDKPWRQK